MLAATDLEVVVREMWIQGTRTRWWSGPVVDEVVAEIRGKLCKLAREACQQLQGAARDVGRVVCGGPVSGRDPLTRPAGISRTLQDLLRAAGRFGITLVVRLSGALDLAGWAGLERESDLQRGMAADEQCNAAPLLHAMRRPVRVARVG